VVLSAVNLGLSVNFADTATVRVWVSQDGTAANEPSAGDVDLMRGAQVMEVTTAITQRVVVINYRSSWQRVYVHAACTAGALSTAVMQLVVSTGGEEIVASDVLLESQLGAEPTP
jgi:hypothetical protein